VVSGRYRAAEVAPKGVERFEWPRLLPRVAAGVEELEWVVWTRVCDTYCHASIERITRRRWNLTAELGRTFQVRILAVFGVDTSTRRSHIGLNNSRAASCVDKTALARPLEQVFHVWAAEVGAGKCANWYRCLKYRN
jgi:hypothetical protein